MMTPASILELYATKGDIAYDGEGITQLEHAWQSGQLALQAAADPALQLASWLHDLGHLMTVHKGTPTLQGIDDQHEQTAADQLHLLWGESVSEPVRLHVQAKRYFVRRHVGYADKLSPDSQRSLALQGGPMSEEECVAFEQQAHAFSARRLRAWDDLAKRKGWRAASTQEALEQLETLMNIVSARQRQQAIA
jgi:predicted HD phosphohydrolase